MTRVDLDALQQTLDANQSLDDGPEYQQVGELVAELRAAREIVNQARLQSRPHARLRAALTAYDQATGGRS